MRELFLLIDSKKSSTCASHIPDEIFSIIEKMMHGIEVNAETLALDAVAAVGPGGHYLAQKHTRNHMREIFLPQFLDRRPYSKWEETGEDARDWAVNKARKILKEHQPDPLDERISKEFERIIKSVEK